MKLTIFNSNEFENKSKSLCERIFSKKYKIYLLGRNELSDELANKIEVEGFIDEFTEEIVYQNKIIISNLHDLLDSNSIVISCVIGKPWKVKEKLDYLKVENIDYFSFWKFSGLELKDPRNFKNFSENFNFENYNLLFEQLEDIHSKSVLENIINFRLNLDISYLKFFTDRQLFQYFEPFLFLESESFIDIGGFDGETSFQFIKYTKTDNKIYFFEPDKINLEIAKNSLMNFSKTINFSDFGIGEIETELKININGSKSFLSEEGEVDIHVRTLDSFFIENTYSESENFYLKMDIEGWEMKALKGAKKFILKTKPKMAICVYHKPNDMIDIYNYIHSIHSDYKIYLRHYTEGVDETVMYFIP